MSKAFWDMRKKHKVFDVIIPVYKPDEKLELLIKALLGQVVRPRNIICMVTTADTAANEAEEKLEREICGYDERVQVHFVAKKDYDHAATRNLGVSLTNTEAELFLMMTQDAVPAGNHLTEYLSACFEDEQVAVAYARQLSGKMSGVPEKCARRFNYPAESRKKTIEDLEELGIKTYFCSNVCAMYRRDVFDELGGFEAPAIFNEDMVYAAKVLKTGRAIEYRADAQVTHWHTYNLTMQFRRSFDNGVSEAVRADVFENVAPAKEGKRYVKETIRTLRRVKQGGKIPYFLLQCAYRYVGFCFGKHYKVFPKSLQKSFSLNRNYWEVRQQELLMENNSGA